MWNISWFPPIRSNCSSLTSYDPLFISHFYRYVIFSKLLEGSDLLVSSIMLCTMEAQYVFVEWLSPQLIQLAFFLTLRSSGPRQRRWSGALKSGWESLACNFQYLQSFSVASCTVGWRTDLGLFTLPPSNFPLLELYFPVYSLSVFVAV